MTFNKKLHVDNFFIALLNFTFAAQINLLTENVNLNMCL